MVELPEVRSAANTEAAKRLLFEVMIATRLLPVQVARSAPEHIDRRQRERICRCERPLRVGLWETQEQHDAWFDENVAPNVPVEISQEVIVLPAVAVRWSENR